MTHWLKRLTGLFLLLSNFALFAQNQAKGSQLEIPEVYVYGQRVIKLVPYKKKIFPFVKIYDTPVTFIPKKYFPLKRFKNPLLEKINIRYRAFGGIGNITKFSIDGATEYFYYPSRFNISANYGSKYSDEKWRMKAGGKIYVKYISPYFSYFHNAVSSDSDTISRHFINLGADISIPYLNLWISASDTKAEENEVYFKSNVHFIYQNFALKVHSAYYTTNIPFFVSLLPELSFKNIEGGIYVSRYLIFPVFNIHYNISGYTLGFSISPEMEYKPLGYYFQKCPFIQNNGIDSIVGGKVFKGIFGIRNINLWTSYYLNYYFPSIARDTLRSIKSSALKIGLSSHYQIKDIYLNGEIGYFAPLNDTIKNFNKLEINTQEKWLYFSLSQDILYRKVNKTNSIIPLIGIKLEYPFKHFNFIFKADNILNRKTHFWDNHSLSGITFYLGATYKFQR